MHLLLSKHRPKDISKEEIAKLWNNLGYSLEALYNTLEEMKAGTYKVREEDFSIPNHYALLAFQAGQREVLQQIMDLLPASAKK